MSRWKGVRAMQGSKKKGKDSGPAGKGYGKPSSSDYGYAKKSSGKAVKTGKK
jgi:hypothetical protein